MYIASMENRIMKIEIFQDDVKIEHKSGVSAKTGKPYNIYNQRAYFHSPDSKFPLAFKLDLEQGQPPYEAGIYTLDDSSFYVDRFGSLSMRPKLIKAKADIKKAV